MAQLKRPFIPHKKLAWIRLSVWMFITTSMIRDIARCINTVQRPLRRWN